MHCSIEVINELLNQNLAWVCCHSELGFRSLLAQGLRLGPAKSLSSQLSLLVKQEGSFLLWWDPSFLALTRCSTSVAWLPPLMRDVLYKLIWDDLSWLLDFLLVVQPFVKGKGVGRVPPVFKRISWLSHMQDLQRPRGHHSESILSLLVLFNLDLILFKLRVDLTLLASHEVHLGWVELLCFFRIHFSFLLFCITCDSLHNWLQTRHCRTYRLRLSIWNWVGHEWFQVHSLLLLLHESLCWERLGMQSIWGYFLLASMSYFLLNNFLQRSLIHHF